MKDKDVKERTPTTEILKNKIIQLDRGDLEDILDLERKNFSPEMQASKESIIDRLDKGHIMLGIRDREKLVGKICFSLSKFSPDNKEEFPKTFSEYSHQAPCEKPNAAFVYDLDVNPNYRGNICVRRLIKAAVDKASLSCCRFFVADCMVSSYNGDSKKHIRQIPSVKDAIDNYLNGGFFPTDEKLTQDPYLAFLKRVTGGKYIWIMPNFMPQDKASGGIRIIGYVDLLEKNNVR